MGLRGAFEVKEHEWLKYYPWKELYEKSLESPFIPKNGDNFDAKYTSQVEKLGNDTRERYDNYLRNESLKEAFRCFTFAPVENRIDSKNFNNPHHNISNCSDINSFNNLDRSINSGISGAMSGSPDKRRDRSVSIENKFLKIKKQSNSASTSSLLRQYRMSNNTNSSTSTSLSYMRRSPSFNNQL